MHWIVKLPDGRECCVWASNPEEAAQYADTVLDPPQPGQKVTLQVKRRTVVDAPWHEVVLHGQCAWTAYLLK